MFSGNFLAACQPESRTVSRAPVYHILWVRSFRGHTISGRGFNLFKPLRRHFRATPSVSRAAIPATETPRLKRSTIDSAVSSAAQDRLESPPNRKFPNCVLHAGLETPRPPGEDRGRLKSSKNHHSTDHVFQKGKSTRESRRGKVDAVHFSGKSRPRARRPASDHLPPSSGQPSEPCSGVSVIAVPGLDPGIGIHMVQPPTNPNPSGARRPA